MHAYGKAKARPKFALYIPPLKLPTCVLYSWQEMQAHAARTLPMPELHDIYHEVRKTYPGQLLQILLSVVGSTSTAHHQ